MDHNGGIEEKRRERHTHTNTHTHSSIISRVANPIQLSSSFVTLAKKGRKRIEPISERVIEMTVSRANYLSLEMVWIPKKRLLKSDFLVKHVFSLSIVLAIVSAWIASPPLVVYSPTWSHCCWFGSQELQAAVSMMVKVLLLTMLLLPAVIGDDWIS